MKKPKCVSCRAELGHFTTVYGTRTERRLSSHSDVHNERLLRVSDTGGLVGPVKDRGNAGDKRTASRRGSIYSATETPVKVTRKFHRKLTGTFCVRCARTDKTFVFKPQDTMVGSAPAESGVQRESDRVRPHATKHISQVEVDVILDVTCECCGVGKTTRTCAQCGRYVCAGACRIVVDGLILCRECDIVTYAPDLGQYAYRGSRQVVLSYGDREGQVVKAGLVVWAGKPIDENMLGHRQCYAVPFLDRYRATGGKAPDVLAHTPQTIDSTYRRSNPDAGYVKGQARNRISAGKVRARLRQLAGDAKKLGDTRTVYTLRDRQGRIVRTTPFASVGK